MEAGRRSRFGDLEIDTVVGKNRKGALPTLNDWATGISWGRKLNGKDSDELARMTIKTLRPRRRGACCTPSRPTTDLSYLVTRK